MYVVAKLVTCAFSPSAIPSLATVSQSGKSSCWLDVKCIAADDDLTDVMHGDSWASARGVAGRPIFSQPSTVSANTLVEVHAHPASWRSLVFISDRVGIQSVVKFDDETGMAEPMAIASDYLKTMVAVAVSARANEQLERMLVLGMGAGSLPSLLSRCCPEAVAIDAVELDGTVAEAACGPMGLDTRRVTVHVDDALAWLSRRAQEETTTYDLIFVDIFDGSNWTPEGFYSEAFMRDLRACLAPRGMVIHNLHSGSAELDRRLDDACMAYAAAFPNAVCRVPALRRGNTIVAAAAFEGAFERIDALHAAADGERRRRGLLFDVSARLQGLRKQ